MPIKPTYPGVYIEELSSGVHAITGVSTSITAFVGLAKTGPINQATRILSYADYERTFGGLVAYSDMSYAVRQFFLNGGSEAWIVRVASTKTKSDTLVLKSKATPKINVLEVDALTPGQTNRSTYIYIERKNDDNTDKVFTLTIVSVSKTTSSDSIMETYPDVNMQKGDAKEAVTTVNSVSKLVTAKRLLSNDTDITLPQATDGHGTLTSDHIDVTTLPHDEQNTTLRISLDGGTPETITVSAGANNKFTTLDEIATTIQSQVTTLKPADPAYKNFTCTTKGNTLVLMSGSYGPNSSVTVTPAINSSLAKDLKLVLTDPHAHATAYTPAPDFAVLSGGQDGPFADAGEMLNVFIDSRSQFKGIYALEKVDLFNILCLPGVTDNGVIDAAASYCEERRAFHIVDCDSGKTPNNMYNAITSTQAGATIPKRKNAAIYYPRIMLADPLDNGNLRAFPASGTIAGVYARTDSARGVWKAPAGIEATLVGAQGLEYVLTDAENGILNPEGVNCLRVFPAFGSVCWGARTLRGGDDTNDSDNKYVSVRRLTYFIEESLYREMKWVIYEPNDESLWAQIRLNVGAFMNTLFRQGAFKGQTPREAYLVKCDKDTTTSDDINNGIVNILVGFAPLKPAEFVIIQIQQLAGQTAI